MPSSATSPAKEPNFAFGRALRNRRTLLFLGSLTIAAAAALNWPWLVAVGAAPLILAALPCMAMCALGLCMKGSGGTCDKAGSSSAPMRDQAAGPAKNALSSDPT